MSSYDDRIAQIWRGIQNEVPRSASVSMSPRSWVARDHPPELFAPQSDRMTFFGMPIVIDNSIPVDELHIVDSGGAHHIVKIG